MAAQTDDTDPLREPLLDAAEFCFEQHGVAGTRMADVAKAAGVSRTTLYKRFASLEDVLKAAFMREFDRFEQRLRPRLARIADPAERLVEIVMSIPENVPDNSGLADALSRGRSRTETMALAAGHDALNERIAAMIQAPLAELAAQRRLRADVDEQEITEWIRRLVFSLSIAGQPASRSRDARRRHVANMLLPALWGHPG